VRNQARREGRLLTRPRQAPCPYHEDVTHDGRNWSPRAELTPVVDRHALNAKLCAINERRSCACERMGDANHRLLEALKKRARS